MVLWDKFGLSEAHKGSWGIWGLGSDEGVPPVCYSPFVLLHKSCAFSCLECWIYHMRHHRHTHSLHEYLCLYTTYLLSFYWSHAGEPSITHFRFTHTPHCLALFLSPVLLVSGDEGPISASVWSLEKLYTRQRQRDRPEENGGNGVTWSLWFVYSIQRSLTQAVRHRALILICTHRHINTHLS